VKPFLAIAEQALLFDQRTILSGSVFVLYRKLNLSTPVR